ncbi:histone deacetylase family protein [Kaistia algarum]|uniref:histone deacetylase family protein n=1 Tax=Kaistia algarum TaxID=2083279 RepID=UPI002687E220
MSALSFSVMKLPIVHHPAYTAEIPADHRFPMGKYRRLAEVLLEAGLAPDGFITPEPASAAQLSLAHDAAYVDQVLSLAVPREIEREIGLPMNETVMHRARAATGGTLLAARLALEAGIACNTAGGSHHARSRQGAGFCTFNDVAVAIRVLMREGRIGTALVVDCDVHQGDGTAEIFEHDANVTTLSLHAARNYPVRKRRSTLDVALDDDLGDADYLAALSGVLPALLDRTHPDIVFYNAGVDPHAGDRLGRLALSDAGLAERDRFVFKTVASRGIPVAGVIGGGYGSDIDAIARRHALMFRAASEQLGS